MARMPSRIPVQAVRSGLRLLWNQSAQVADGAARHGISLCSQRENRQGMAADGRSDRDAGEYPQIRGDWNHPAANHQAIAEALTFHEGIGIERKAARLRYLKERWIRRLEGRRAFVCSHRPIRPNPAAWRC